MTPLQQYKDTLVKARVRKFKAIERLEKCHLMMAEAAKNLLEMEQATCSHETLIEGYKEVYRNHGTIKETWKEDTCARCGIVK